MNDKDSNALRNSENCVCDQKSQILGVVEEIKQGRGKTFAYAREVNKARGVAPKECGGEEIVQP
jgi:hypothetical protein